MFCMRAISERTGRTWESSLADRKVCGVSCAKGVENEKFVQAAPQILPREQARACSCTGLVHEIKSRPRTLQAGIPGHPDTSISPCQACADTGRVWGHPDHFPRPEQHIWAHNRRRDSGSL